MCLTYFIIALFATMLGAVTGMGGGVIIKPLLDLLGNVASISMLSSITIFVMAAISLFRYRKNDKLTMTIAVPLAVGAATGGNLGSLLLDALLKNNAKPSNVTVVQNAALCALIVLVFGYMLHKEEILSLQLSGVFASILTGLILGIIAAFLGIGGGPINVAVIVFVFGVNTRVAILCSLLIILSSQASKLLFIAVFSGFSGYNLSILPAMFAGAIVGSIFGSSIYKHSSNQFTDTLFNMAPGRGICNVLYKHRAQPMTSTPKILLIDSLFSELL